MAEATEAKAALRAQNDDANEQLRQLRQTYRIARDEIASLHSVAAATAASSKPPSETEAVIVTLREKLATVTAESAHAAAAAADELRELKQETLDALKSEAEAARRAEVAEAARRETGESLAASTAEARKAEARAAAATLRAEQEAAEAADSKASANEARLQAEEAMAQAAAARRAVQPATPGEQSEHSDLRKRVLELEAALNDQMRANFLLERQADQRLAEVRRELCSSASVSASAGVSATSSPETKPVAAEPASSVLLPSSHFSVPTSVSGTVAATAASLMSCGAASVHTTSNVHAHGESEDGARVAEAKAAEEQRDGAEAEGAEQAEKADVVADAMPEYGAADEAQVASDRVNAKEVAANGVREKKTEVMEAQQATAGGVAAAAAAAAAAVVAAVEAPAPAILAQALPGAAAIAAVVDVETRREGGQGDDAVASATPVVPPPAVGASGNGPSTTEAKANGMLASDAVGGATGAVLSSGVGGGGSGTGGAVGGGGGVPAAGPQGDFRWSGAQGEVHCAYSTMTHVGGSGNKISKHNQDAHFVARPAEDSIVWGVLDGHGPDNGCLAATTAAEALCKWFEKNVGELNASPQASMAAAFEHAHSAVRAAIVSKYKKLGTPLATTADNFLLEDDGQPVDGGATATVVALLQGHLLVVANVGDSDCLLGGKLADGSIGFEQLCADHTPTNVEEYIRVAKLTEEHNEEWEPALFCYDADDQQALPDLQIFTVSEEGSVAIDTDLANELDEMGLGFKNERGDRPTALVVPESNSYGQQKLGMTRALGDFYLQHHGATWEPAVSCIDLLDVVGQLNDVALVLASDGLWDVWNYKDVLKWPLRALESKGNVQLDAGSVTTQLLALITETRILSHSLFEESADNITAIVVAFDEITPEPAKDI